MTFAGYLQRAFKPLLLQSVNSGTLARATLQNSEQSTRRFGSFGVGIGGAALLCSNVLNSGSKRCLLTESQMTENRVLGDRHRIVITHWAVSSEPSNGPDPLNRNPFHLTDDAMSLFNWCKTHGYEGLEMTVDDFRKRWFAGKPYEYVAQQVNSCVQRSGLPIVGSLYHVTDGDQGTPDRRMHNDGTRYDLDLKDSDFWEEMGRRMDFDKAIGSEYITFQISLPPQYMNTGGEYREDDIYISRVAQDIAKLQSMCFYRGMDFYVETHMDRMTEDPCGFVRIMQACPTYFEVNADISHYNYRGLTKGKYLNAILQRVGHTHQRMARQFGDLSSDVEGPEQDWEAKGVTWQAMESMRPALKGGLSSRCIVGESGPLHLVKDPMALDAKLIPLYRAMAKLADAEAAQQAIANPFKP